MSKDRKLKAFLFDGTSSRGRHLPEVFTQPDTGFVAGRGASDRYWVDLQKPTNVYDGGDNTTYVGYSGNSVEKFYPNLFKNQSDVDKMINHRMQELAKAIAFGDWWQKERQKQVTDLQARELFAVYMETTRGNPDLWNWDGVSEATKDGWRAVARLMLSKPVNE